MKKRTLIIFGASYLCLYLIVNALIMSRGSLQNSGPAIYFVAVFESPALLLWTLFRWDIDFFRDAVYQVPIHLAYYLLLFYLIGLFVNKIRQGKSWKRIWPAIGLAAVALWQLALIGFFLMGLATAGI